MTLIICKTMNGRYAVHPIDWAGIWDKNGVLQDGINNLAEFDTEDDAKRFIAQIMCQKEIMCHCPILDCPVLPKAGAITSFLGVSMEDLFAQPQVEDSQNA